MSQKYGRYEWVKASQFHSDSDEEALQKVLQRVKEYKGYTAPLLLFDLDSTLYEVQPRTHAIIRDWAHSISHFGEALSQKFKSTEHHHIGYSLRDTFHNLGLKLEHSEIFSAWEHMKSYWTQRFFSNEYLKHDKPYPGAVDYVKELYDLGAHVVYLTGRDEPRMGVGTRANLKRDGFPIDQPRTHLLLKVRGEVDDLEHKKSCIHFVQKHGTLLASFENEPQNFVALTELFPEAIHVFMDTVCSEAPAYPAKNAYRIKGFGRRK